VGPRSVARILLRAWYHPVSWPRLACPLPPAVCQPTSISLLLSLLCGGPIAQGLHEAVVTGLPGDARGRFEPQRAGKPGGPLADDDELPPQQPGAALLPGRQVKVEQSPVTGDD